MYRVLDESEQSIVGIKVDHYLTGEDWSGLTPYLQERRNEVGLLNILFDFTMLERQKFTSCWADLIFNLQRISDVKRLAVTGNQLWGEAQLLGVEGIPHIEVKCFPSEQIDEAWTWLKGYDA